MNEVKVYGWEIHTPPTMKTIQQVKLVGNIIELSQLTSPPSVATIWALYIAFEGSISYTFKLLKSVTSQY